MSLQVESLFRTYHARRTKKLSELYVKPRSSGKSVHPDTENTGEEQCKNRQEKEEGIESEQRSVGTVIYVWELKCNADIT